MQRDFKIGLMAGLVVVVAAAIYLAGKGSLCPRPRTVPARPEVPELAAPAGPDYLQQPAPEPNGVDEPSTVQDTLHPARRYHVVGKNQTLSDIAQLYYGSPAKWPKIYNANRDRLKNPDSLRAGTRLTIPE